MKRKDRIKSQCTVRALCPELLQCGHGAEKLQLRRHRRGENQFIERETPKWRIGRNEGFATEVVPQLQQKWCPVRLRMVLIWRFEKQTGRFGVLPEERHRR